MPRKKITKTEGVRRALEELGNDAKPEAIRAFLKDTFKIRMKNQHISSAKSQLLKAAATSSARLPVANGPGRSVARQPAIRSGTPDIADLRVVKELTLRLGAEQVKELADIVG